MNRISFLDELVKIGSATDMIKAAYGGGSDAGTVNTVDIPHGMVGSDPVPESTRLSPDDASSRLPNSSKVPSAIRPGRLGGVTQAKDPVDRFRFNRVYRDRR